MNTESHMPRVAHYRFVSLLAALGLLMVSSPVVESLVDPTNPLLADALLGGAFFLLLSSTVFALSASRVAVIMSTALAVPSLILWLIDLRFQSDVLAVCQAATGVVFLGYAVTLILIHVFSVQRVTGNMVAASLCVYLLLGVLWAEGYSILSVIDPDAFKLAWLSDQPFRMEVHGRGVGPALYFSFVTMTTLGYGDIVPTSLGARTLAYCQAVTGQMYMAVLVARLVGLHIVHSTGSRSG